MAKKCHVGTCLECEESWVQIGNKCYKSYFFKTSRKKAFNQCGKLEGHLFTPTSKQEENGVFLLMRILYGHEVDSTYLINIEKNIKYSNWCYGYSKQSDRYNKQYCIVHNSENNCWKYEYCTSHHFFICEKSLVSTKPKLV